jgi:pepF/M3 family oligoendopeptidase
MKDAIRQVGRFEAAVGGNRMKAASLGQMPHWDLSGIYPGLESPEFDLGWKGLVDRIDDLDRFMEAEGIRKPGEDGKPAKDPAAGVDGFLARTDEILRHFKTIEAFIYGYVSVDSFDTTAKRRLSELELLGVRVETQEMRFKGWLGATVGEVERLDGALKGSKGYRDHAFYLRETVEQSRYLMSDAEETLASELVVSGGAAWGKLQGTVTSQVTIPFEVDGESRELPAAELQNIVRYHPEESVRRRAFEAEIKAWEAVREPLAACLNGVKGDVNTLDRRRGRQDALHAALDAARIDRPTLEAMLSVMRESFPLFRKYFRAKARLLGKEQLAWWDLFAPVGSSERSFTFDEAREFIVRQFGQFSERLAGLARRAFDQRWIDAEPRKGKRGGAFCMEVPLQEESRILANFDGSLDQVLTLAHELGHAFHNECHVGLSILQRRTPMTLAETASILNESLITEASLATAGSPAEELSILESFLQGSSQIVVDIYSRFLFEKEVFERRARSELSADDFCEIMTRCQRETYGDGLDESRLHPYMWAWKPHYYSPGLSFYNFPYAFGLLFGLGLFAEFRRRGAAFVADYEALLRGTGSGSAADLAGGFGIDLRQPAFWRGSMKVIEARLDRYLEI